MSERKPAKTRPSFSPPPPPPPPRECFPRFSPFAKAVLSRVLKTLFPVFAALIVFLLPRSLDAGVSVIISPENLVSGERITLGSIADITPDGEAADPETENALLETLGSIDLGATPDPNGELRLKRRELETILLASGGPVKEARWLIPETVTVTGRGIEPSHDRIADAVKEYLNGAEPYASGRYDILSLKYAKPPSLPRSGKVECRFSPQPSPNPAHLTGTIHFGSEGKELARLRVNVRMDLSVPALTAARDLPKGKTLTWDDLTENHVTFAGARGALNSAEQGVGRTLKLALRAGEPVRERDLVQTSAVLKGDNVTIIAQSGGLKVSALGQARESGSLGDTIAVVNLDSKKTISAKVAGPGQVEVIF
ncbi:MAG: flagellar basal body P-ring formation chaperone FlgA [Deltaproteobacteria bacterium]|jgi:flagella basal body P-ring formation protein FlgA|nr:flagellar basal body P-ring formation chaperone FlgA [Deltaproteobacteria bacterium]